MASNIIETSNIKVVVRVRPENAKEQSGASRNIIEVLDDQVLIFDPKIERESFYFKGRKEDKRNLLYKDNKNSRFIFDRVFHPESSNKEVFENTTRGLLEGLLNGYNCSVFAYGATGAGKTHTMLGSPNEAGVMFLTLMELYHRIDEIKDEKSCEISVSYLEIYNENVMDLLKPSGPLNIREDPDRNVIVGGLTLHKPEDSKDLFKMLAYGNKNRTQHPTDANLESSRSHAVCIVYVKQRDRAAKLTNNVKAAKLCLVDLAGSERATMVSSNRLARIREGANINKSLLALGGCINALADTKSRFIPYRNSKLTHLLKDSIGGNCRTVMIAAISPSSLSYEDTYNTLKYAERAKHITVDLKKNVMNIDVHFSKYPQLVADLHVEIAKLKEKLKEFEETNPTRVPKPPPFGTPKTEEINRLKQLLQSVYAERKIVERDRLEVESSDREIEARIHYRQMDIDRLALIATDSEKFNKSAMKADSTIQFLKGKQQRMNSRRVIIIDRLQENKECQARIESEAKLINPNGQVPEDLIETSRMLQLEVELTESRLLVKHLKRLLKSQAKEANKTERLLTRSLKTLKRNHLLLKAHDIATSDIIEEFEATVKMVEGNKEVIWADQLTTKDTFQDVDGSDQLLERLMEIPVTSEVKLTPAALRTPYHPRTSSTPASAFIKNYRRKLVEFSPEKFQSSFFGQQKPSPIPQVVSQQYFEKSKPSFIMPIDFNETGISLLDLGTPLKMNLSSVLSIESEASQSTIEKSDLELDDNATFCKEKENIQPLKDIKVPDFSSQGIFSKTWQAKALSSIQKTQLFRSPSLPNINATFTARDAPYMEQAQYIDYKKYNTPEAADTTFVSLIPQTREVTALKEITKTNLPIGSQAASSSKIRFKIPGSGIKKQMYSTPGKKGISRKSYGVQQKLQTSSARAIPTLKRDKSVTELSAPKREKIASCLNELNLVPQHKVNSFTKGLPGLLTPAQRVKVDSATDTEKPSTSRAQRTPFKLPKTRNPQWRR